MSLQRRVALLAALIAMGLGLSWLGAAEKTQDRDALMKLHRDGNFKDAYEGLRKLALDPNDDPAKVSQDLRTGINCLQRLGRVDEVDEFREGVIAAHGKNWRLLQTAAHTYTEVDHRGFIVAGKFDRGFKRGGGRMVNAMQRDRTRALQLMQQALANTKTENDKPALASFCMDFAHQLLNGAGYHAPWRLQYLTDLSQLPDYDEGHYNYWGGNDRGAPVDADNNPVYHSRPKTYEDSKTDGERWRWMLMQAVEFDPSRRNEIDMHFANFLMSQFGEQTMAYFRYFRGGDDSAKSGKTGTFALHTLGEDETIARLASGIKRFKVPEEFNWIKIFQTVAGRGKSSYGEQARDQLASIFENRRQYPKAAQAWRDAIADYGVGGHNHRQQRLDQIINNWGMFEPFQDQPAGKKATVDFRFRNATKLSLEAHAVLIEKLLGDVKGYIKNAGVNPRLDWEHTQINNIGWRLVEKQQKQYQGDKVAGWDLTLKPRAEHWDDRVTIQTPLQKPGAYLVTGTLDKGNISRAVVWVTDTVIVKKQLEGKNLYYVADAMMGQPIPKADMEFFGYRTVNIGVNQWKIETKEFSETTDNDGQVLLGDDKMPQGWSWLITARKSKAGKDGADRFAYLGFTHTWYQGKIYDPEYNQTKVFFMSDRPVYRPDQKAQFKFWVRHAKYDQPDSSDFANKTFTLRINNPQGQKVVEKQVTTDEFAGVADEFPIASGAMLGQYQITIHDGNRAHGWGQIRVEEYKKPEFEVQVEAPKEPVMLGEPVLATIKAKYYFGSPVTSAKVKYKVTRSSYSSTWYPTGSWDWLYGKGYWWFGYDYMWYPGFREWGCMRPYMPWWGWRHQDPPELVMESEAVIGPDGTLQVPINTLPAKELHGDEDHQFTITAEVTDESRRTIVGTGNVLAARKPFRVFAWLDRGHYRVGDTVKASFKAHTLDQKPVEGKGEATLYRISYNDKNEPVEKAVRKWSLDTNIEGTAQQQLKASQPGQYRLAYRLTDKKEHTIEGGYVFVVRGEGFDGRDFRFNELELVTDRREYAPGDKVKLMINTNTVGGVVLLFTKPTNGIYLPPKTVRLVGKSAEEEIAVVQRDMPNFFVEAVTVAEGRVHSETREVVVPPEKRILNVNVLPSQQEYKPGQKATVKVKLTDFFGKPFIGQTVLTMYDKSVEYISGGSNVAEIGSFFWNWRRHHQPHMESSLQHYGGNILRTGEIGMSYIGVFGHSAVEEFGRDRGKGEAKNKNMEMLEKAAAPGMGGAGGPARPMAAARMAQNAPMEADAAKKDAASARDEQASGGDAGQPGVQPAIRKNFADTALWVAALKTNQEGIAEVSVNMPENLTAWKVKVWAMGHGTKVGQGEAEVTTKKDLLVRLQAPRFFVQKDEVVLSANVHNYLKSEKLCTVSLEMEGGCLVAAGTDLTQRVKIPSSGEKRVDWRVKVQSEGQAIVRMKAVTDEESDAMQMSFPCYVHGMLKMDSYSGVVRPDKESGSVTFNVPAERRINESRLEVRYSPTLAGAMVDALPYMVDYPYGCTEQTLNRFLPAVVTQRTLQRMNLDLKQIQEKRTNLNAQEIGDDKQRAKGWKRFDRNPVFDDDEMKKIVNTGVDRLAAMQCSDGGWGWFSGWGEQSWPHTTAVVVHGLQISRQNDVKLPQNMFERGVAWLKNYQVQEVQKIKNAPAKIWPWKSKADNLDAFVYMILAEEKHSNGDMRDFLYRDRVDLSVYAKAMFGIALHQEQQAEKLAMILKNCEQFLVQDDENQTAYLKLPEGSYWWHWYGSEIESNAYYLKLLSRTNAKDERASRLVKYLLNNRKHSTYWNSTRDSAVCVEAMAEYIKNSGEDKPNLTVEVYLDGKKHKEVKIDPTNLFTFDNKFVLEGAAVESGKHTLEIKKKGTGPVYFNAYVTNFTLEDFIQKAGLEVKVNRKYYKLDRVKDATIKVSGARGQALDQKIEKYKRTEIQSGAELKSGDLVEVELEIDSKNDYEYLCFEDPKAAGFEAVQLRSGYGNNDMGAFMEMRDDRVCFFVRALARGKHSVSYRLRAEIPGKFSALPTRGYAMYAPELKGNSDEIKLQIAD